MSTTQSGALNLLKKYVGQLTVRRVNKASERLLENKSSWPRDVQLKLGALLIDLLVKTATIETIEVPDTPAFFHSYRYTRNRQMGVLRAANEVYETIERGHMLREVLHARHLPMVVPPRRWEAPELGGYLAEVSSVCWIVAFVSFFPLRRKGTPKRAAMKGN